MSDSLAILIDCWDVKEYIDSDSKYIKVSESIFKVSY